MFYPLPGKISIGYTGFFSLLTVNGLSLLLFIKIITMMKRQKINWW